MLCIKTHYADLATARSELAKIRAIKDGREKPIRAYVCDICGNCHLTKLPRNKANKILRIKQLKAQEREFYLKHKVEIDLKNRIAFEADFWNKKFKPKKNDSSGSTKPRKFSR